jgi:MFS family permease
LSLSYLTYGVAMRWEVAVIAMIGYWLGFSTSNLSCSTICGNCLVNRDRATGMLICETLAAGILGMAGPMFSAWLVMRCGGVNLGGIRPIFFVGLAVMIATFFIVLTQLSDQRWVKPGIEKPHLIRDISRVFHGGLHLKKWLVIGAVSQLPLGMVFPFTQVFAHRIKGADELILGAMVTGSALSSILFAIPLGRLADRIGRKRVLYITMPLFWLSNLLLIWATSPALLVLAGILQGFYFIGAPVVAAIERELVPPEQMGRWIGINRFFKMAMAAVLALCAGLIWDRIGPQFIFLIFVAVDLVVRLPLLMVLPETLHVKFRPRSGE